MYRSVHLRRAVSWLPAALCVFLCALLVVRAQPGIEGIRRGMSVCFSAIIPAIFPFLLAADYLFTALCGANKMPRRLSVALAVLFGMLGGFVMGAKALSDLTARGALTEKRAARLLAGCVNAGPSYLISGVGLGLFGNPRAGLLLFVSLSAASLCCCALSPLVFPDSAVRETTAQRTVSPRAKPDFSASLSYALHATLNLCANIIFFSCIGAYLSDLLALTGWPQAVRWGLLSLCEVSNGCAAAAGIGSVTGLLLAGASVSLCGVSILMQVRSILRPAHIRMRYFLLSRPVHLLLTLALLRVLIPLFGNSTSVWAQQVIIRCYSLSPLFSIFFILVAVIFVLGERQESAAAGSPLKSRE